MDKILIHICCAPCSIEVVDYFISQGIKVVGFFFNPYIHPYTEFKARYSCTKEYFEKNGIPLFENLSYQLEEYFEDSLFRGSERCRFCYKKRLEATAKMAEKSGFKYYTTTLLASTYQKHEWIQEIGKDQAKKSGIEFFDYDFRKVFREGLDKARKENLYMQQYCGCILSEKERYQSDYIKLTGGKKK